MKQLLFLLTLWGNVVVSQAQISSIKIEPKKETVTVVPYDSLDNISEENYKSLVGQTLFLLPTAKEKKDGYYLSLDLLTSPSMTYNASRYKPSPQSSRFVHEVVDFSVSSKYYDILDAFEKGDGYDKRYFLKLCERESKDILYYRFAHFEAPSSHFMVLGYYEKRKQIYKGKKCAYQSWCASLYPLYSLSDGSKVIKAIPNNTLFDCTDVTFLENEYFTMIYKLHHNTYGDLYAKDYGFTSLFKSYEEYLNEQKNNAARRKKLIAKYGQRNGQLISEGRVRIGFTKAMCKEAWGEPEDINTSRGSWGVHEQWCYRDGSYLYFKNGKLTSIQE